MRQLLDHERPIVEYLFDQAKLQLNIEELYVTPMLDGGMGSLALGANYESRSLGRELAECHFIDADDVPVSVTLNADSNGDPYEVDVWKVNFQPTIRWPTRDQVHLGPPSTSPERPRGR